MLADSIVADQYPAIANGKHQSRGIGGIIEGSSSEGLEKVLFLRPEDCSRFLGASSTSFLAFRKELLERDLRTEEVKNHNSGITNLTGGLYLK